MSGVRRDTSGDSAASLSAGINDFWSGEPFDVRADDDWQAGWRSAANVARRQAHIARPLLDKKAGLSDTLTDAYAALKRANDMPRLTPGSRALITRTLARIDAFLEHLAPTKQNPGPERETTAV